MREVNEQEGLWIKVSGKRLEEKPLVSFSPTEVKEELKSLAVIEEGILQEVLLDGGRTCLSKVY